MHNTFLTIVVPAYNVELYLEQCLESLIHQTMMAHKVIVINDGSKDSTGEIAEKYAKNYPELIRYISQENRGLGAARNVGLEYVDTPYITFLDSDDWLMPTFVETVYSRIGKEKEEPELVYTLPCIFDMATQRTRDWMDKPLFMEIFYAPHVVVNPEQTPQIYALEPNACRKVYQVSFLRRVGFSFPKGTKWEDVEPHFQLLHEATRCIGIESVGFFYRVNSGNQITATGGPDRLQVISVFSRCLAKAIDEQWSDLEISYIIRMMQSFVKWSVDCTAVDIRIEFAKQLHFLYKSIPKTMLKCYYRDMKVRINDRFFISLARSPFYVMIGVAQYYELLRSIMRKFIR